MRYSFAAGDVKLVFCSASDRYKGKLGSKICTAGNDSDQMSSLVVEKHNG